MVSTVVEALAWFEGLDQMASQHRAVEHVGGQYGESSSILFMAFQYDLTVKIDP